MVRITASDILLFVPQSWVAAGAQSASPPAAPPLTPDPSFVPTVVVFSCFVLFTGLFAVYHWHFSDTSFAAIGDPTSTFTTLCPCVPHGIDSKLLDTFPIVTYSTITVLKPQGVPWESCAVCLSEFNHHDNLRLLPKCNHFFHRHCIDAWLASHMTCPICRARLKSEQNRRGGGNKEVAILIPNEGNAHQMFDESSMSRMDPSSGEASLRRCHTTGHSLGFGQGGRRKEFERYDLRLPPDDVSDAEFHGRQGDGSRRERLGHSLTSLLYVSHGNIVSPPSSSPPNMTSQVGRRSTSLRTTCEAMN